MELKLTNNAGGSINAHLDYRKDVPSVKLVTQIDLSPEYQEEIKKLGANITAADEFDFPAPDFGEPPFFDFMSFWEDDDTYYKKIKAEEVRVKELISTIWSIEEI